MTEPLTAVVVVPGLRIENPLNGSHGHWRAVQKRGVAETAATKLCLSQLGAGVRDALRGSAVVRVRLVRLCRREFDDDGLAAGFKAVRDAVSDWLRPGLPPGRADGKKYGLVFEYGQDTGSGYGVRIELTAGG